LWRVTFDYFSQKVFLKESSAFTIYNASAGSGKTFTIVKEYLKKILSSRNEEFYKNLLAITFTNKAVAEMKQRIIENLVSFTTIETLSHPSEMFLRIGEEIKLSPNEIRTKANDILKHLLHHYSGFCVETIDSFNHRLIRTFARDLKLTSNFEVSLEAPQLIEESIERLISKAGADNKVTKILVDFVLEKTDDDKSWDISRDISNASKLLLNENDAIHVISLKEKSLDDFIKFKKILVEKKEELLEKIELLATDNLRLIEESGLEFKDFTGGYFPKFLTKLEKGDFSIDFNTSWQANFNYTILYTAATIKKNPAIAEIIDELTPSFRAAFGLSRSLIFELKLTNSILQNLSPLSVINLVSQEFEKIKIEKNILPVSDFNSLINREIKGQPVPFIYERLGEKYRHFFIDEFQDTSQMQWDNIMPLIANSLSQSQSGDLGSLLLVGDAKQSIYRWRGGLPELFMELYNGENLFNLPAEIKNLETNFRSCQEIIDFNNRFFTFSATFLGNKIHENLYEKGNKQKFTEKEGGYVKIQFIEAQDAAEKNEIYPQLIYDTIIDLKSKSFEEKDICILTRSVANGLQVGKFLLEKNISVVSSETLLLRASAKVQCIILTLSLEISMENQEARVQLLDLLHRNFNISKEKHTFFMEFLNQSSSEFSEKLKEYNIDFSFSKLHSFSLYESCEYIIKQFKLNFTADAYLFGFMDLVYEFVQQARSDKMAFLNFWETKKEKASIASSGGTNAVQIMTIHKAKGLEFPVVLFPYADIDLHKTNGDKIWYSLNESQEGFNEVQINYSKGLKDFGEYGEKLYNEYSQTLELDNLNLLYVTLTRAVEQLYIFSVKPDMSKASDSLNYNRLLGNFLINIHKWDDDKEIYDFGNSVRTIKSSFKSKSSQITPIYIASSPSENSLKIVPDESILWNTKTQNSIYEGNILHDIMAQIKSMDDFDYVFDTLEEECVLSSEDLENLKTTVFSIINHRELKHYFDSSQFAKNEVEIITHSGRIIRPDRLIFHEDESVTVVDYKTGLPNSAHQEQIYGYGQALEEMGLLVAEKILVYVNPEEIVINKV